MKELTWSTWSVGIADIWLLQAVYSACCPSDKRAQVTTGVGTKGADSGVWLLDGMVSWLVDWNKYWILMWVIFNLINCELLQVYSHVLYVGSQGNLLQGKYLISQRCYKHQTLVITAFSFCLSISFSALTLWFGQQEEHLACKMYCHNKSHVYCLGDSMDCCGMFLQATIIYYSMPVIQLTKGNTGKKSLHKICCSVIYLISYLCSAFVVQNNPIVVRLRYSLKFDGTSKIV